MIAHGCGFYNIDYNLSWRKFFILFSIKIVEFSSGKNNSIYLLVLNMYCTWRKMHASIKLP